MTRNVLILLLACATQAACERSVPDLHGQIYFAAGNYLGSLDLYNGSATVIANLGDETIDQVAAYRHGELLLSTVVAVDGRDIDRVTFFRIQTLEHAPLYRGRYARYLPEQRTVLYDDGFALRADSLSREFDAGGVILEHGQNRLTEIVLLSGGSLLYELRGDAGRTIGFHNVISRETTDLPRLSDVCRLDGALWISTSQQLVCRLSDDSGHALTSLDGEVIRRLNLPDDNSFRALAFLHDQKTLLLSERWQSALGGQQRWAVWAYDFAGNQAHRLLEDQYLGDFVVYQPLGP